MLPKGYVQLYTAEKPVNRLGWWKGKFALFQMPATGGGGGEGCVYLSKDLLSPHWQPMGQEFL